MYESNDKMVYHPKYACRWKNKNGIQDLEKIMWYTQHLIDYLKKG